MQLYATTFMNLVTWRWQTFEICCPK